MEVRVLSCALKIRELQKRGLLEPVRRILGARMLPLKNGLIVRPRLSAQSVFGAAGDKTVGCHGGELVDAADMRSALGEMSRYWVRNGAR